MSESVPVHFDLRIRLFREEKYFGPGIAELMERVERTGSISAACREMGMAYSKAWKILRRAEHDLGFSLLEAVSGGASGGSSRVTERGKEMLTRYRAMEAAVKAYAEEQFERYFGEDIS